MGKLAPIAGNGTLSSQIHYYTLAGHLIGSTDGTNTTISLTNALGSVLLSFSQSAILVSRPASNLPCQQQI